MREYKTDQDRFLDLWLDLADFREAETREQLAEAKSRVDRGFGQKDAISRGIEIEKVEQVVRARRITIGGNKLLVAFDRLIQ